MTDSAFNDVLRMLTVDNLKPKEIAIKRDTSIQAVYKIIKKLKERGLLQRFNSRGLKPTTTLVGGGVYYRIHGLQYDIKIISESEIYKNALARGNKVNLKNNAIIFYNDKIEIYQDKDCSFIGISIEESFNKAISYFNELIYKLESRYNITLLKEGYHNINIVNGHIAEVNNGIAKELYLRKEFITIYGKDGKAWFKIDYSKRLFKEAETIHPREFKRDAHIIFGKYLNDWREKEPKTNSELEKDIIDLKMDMPGQRLNDIMQNCHSIYDLCRRKDIGELTIAEKDVLSNWTFERFKA